MLPWQLPWLELAVESDLFDEVAFTISLKGSDASLLTYIKAAISSSSLETVTLSPSSSENIQRSKCLIKTNKSRVLILPIY